MTVPTAERFPRTPVFVLKVRGRVIGAVFDAVSDVLALGADSIKPAPEMNASVIQVDCCHFDSSSRLPPPKRFDAFLQTSGEWLPV
jgi:hypothetical protein